jgi:hypothetical protein
MRQKLRLKLFVLARNIVAVNQDGHLKRRFLTLTAASLVLLCSSLLAFAFGYPHADYWGERVRIMDWWAGRCREMEAGGIVIPLRAI